MASISNSTTDSNLRKSPFSEEKQSILTALHHSNKEETVYSTYVHQQSAFSRALSYSSDSEESTNTEPSLSYRHTLHQSTGMAIDSPSTCHRSNPKERNLTTTLHADLRHYFIPIVSPVNESQKLEEMKARALMAAKQKSLPEIDFETFDLKYLGIILDDLEKNEEIFLKDQKSVLREELYEFNSGNTDHLKDSTAVSSSSSFEHGQTGTSGFRFSKHSSAFKPVGKLIKTLSFQVKNPPVANSPKREFDFYEIFYPWV